MQYNISLLTAYDIYLFKEGTHAALYEKLGAHPMTVEGICGTLFAVWAPNAKAVSVIGDFNGWNSTSHPLRVREDQSGIWEGFIPSVSKGAIYKYHIHSRYNDYHVEKGDPFALCWETPPKTGSIVWELDYNFQDDDWKQNLSRHNSLASPMSIYEVHLGSWRRVPEEGNRSLSYLELAYVLPAYIKEMGFTHVEFMPIMEHPFYGSWGYQVTGYFAPTHRYGNPGDLMFLIDRLHQSGIGVILDWVPSHFPADQHGLSYFDGTHLFEHADRRKGFHPDWKSEIFNYGRHEVRSFLMSSALFWLRQYHFDALRVDAVASMLYLDYGRKEGEWVPNERGGRENLDAIHFIKSLNKSAYDAYPAVQMIAEESTAWPMVSRPTDVGGLGFGMKWMLGWMHDTLSYFAKDPLLRKYHHHELTFSLWYAFNENFVLPLSHDEVVHGKGSLIGKMPGEGEQQFAHMRLLLGWMYGHPGKKLLFMGGEFGQIKEWAHDESIEWHCLDYPWHRGLQLWVADLNRFYREEPALYELDFSEEGFEWIVSDDREQSIIGFIRKGNDPNRSILALFNLTPVTRHNYRVGVPQKGFWKERLNSDAKAYGGSSEGNLGGVMSEPVPYHGRDQSISLTLPPLGSLFLMRFNNV
jgi:1,4-alpha-glucan branching enzyme